MAKKPKPKRKPKPLSPTLTGTRPKSKPMKNRPKGSGFLGPKPGLGAGVNAQEVAGASGRAGTANAAGQFAALSPAFRQLSDQQFGQVNRFAKGLDNQYTRDARGQVRQSFGAADRVRNVGNQTVAAGQRAGRQITNLAPVAQRQANQAGNQIGGLGSILANQARQGFATSGPTTIEAEMYRQGERELALGRSLSPEQLREATQGARQGMAARGMATGNAGLGAELLNRDRFATQRQSERRAFATGANQLREENVMARRNAAGNMATAGGNLFDAAGRMRLLGTTTAGDLRGMGAETTMRGQSLGGSLLADAGRLRQSGAGMMADLDPFSRAINPGLALGQSAQSMGLGTIGQSNANMLDLFANTGSFNVNRNDSFYKAFNNNMTAVRTGQMASQAQTNAANISAAATRSLKPSPFETVIGGLSNFLGLKN